MNYSTATIDEKYEEMDFSFLKGKKIVNIGVITGNEYCGQYNFAIDYEDSGIIKRVVVSSTDLGIWIEWQGELGKENDIDILKKKLNEFLNDPNEDFVVKIVDIPFKRGYAFVTESGKVVFHLSIKELKMMNDMVREHFTKSGERNDANAIYAISLWATG